MVQFERYFDFPSLVSRKFIDNRGLHCLGERELFRIERKESTAVSRRQTSVVYETEVISPDSLRL